MYSNYGSRQPLILFPVTCYYAPKERDFIRVYIFVSEALDRF